MAATFAGPHRIARLAPTGDGLSALATALAAAGTWPGAVHLFCHGEPGVLELAGARISLETLAGDSPGVAGVRRALAGRPLIVYGCSVGRGSAGRRFVDTLSLVLSAPVLASSTPVGGAVGGGDWDLDVAGGAEPRDFAVLPDPEPAARWAGLLATATVTNTLGDTSAGSVRAAAAAVPDTVDFSNLGSSATITLGGSLNFTLGSATLWSFSGTTTSLTIGGAGITAASHLYFDLGSGNTLTVDSDLTTPLSVLVLSGTSTLNGSIAAIDRLWINGGTAVLGTTTSAPLIDIQGNSTLRLATDAAYTSQLRIEDTATIDTGANTVSFSGAVSDDGSNVLVKTGAGTLTLSGTNSASGTMTVSKGTLSVAADANLSAGAITLNGGTLAVTGATTIDNAIALGASNGTVNLTADATLSGVISGSGALTKTGASTVTLSGTNTFSGGTTVSAGTLTVSGGGALSDTGTVTVDAGATLDLNGTSETVGALSGAGAITLGSGTLTVDSGTNTTFSGALSGTGGLAKTGAGTLTLSGTNTYTGGTTVSTGTLLLSGGNALSDTGTVTVDAGATLDLNGTAETIGSLAGSGTVSVGAGAITLSNAGASSFAGSITGTGTFSVASGVTLGGTGTYSTPVTVLSGGGIAPGNSPGAIATGDLTLQSGATASMEITGTTAGTGYDQINVTGTVTINSATLTLAVGYAPSSGDSYILIANDGSDAVVGTFGGLAEGATVTTGGRSYLISYAGGTGNDVTLTALALPSSSGDGGVDATGPYYLVGNAGNETFFGSAGADTVYGMSGNDYVRADAGADLAYGNPGADTLVGNAGADTLFGGQDGDLIYGNQDGDALYGNLAADTIFGGQDSDSVFGGQGDDLLYGNLGGDLLVGGNGNDTVYGGQGDDTLSGGAGDDRLAGNLSADTYRFGSGDGADTVSGFALAEGDTIAVTAGVNGTTIASAADLLARLGEDASGNAVLDLGSGNTVTLLGVAPASVSADWFMVG